MKGRILHNLLTQARRCPATGFGLGAPKAYSTGPRWQHIQPAEAGCTPCTRSSHGISMIGSRVFAFGGEHVARTPIDSTMYSIDLGKSSDQAPAWQAINAEGDKPAERVAHAQAVIGESIYVF